ncbi:unnamed protein product [Malus baccata var. baccata]
MGNLCWIMGQCISRQVKRRGLGGGSSSCSSSGGSGGGGGGAGCAVGQGCWSMIREKRSRFYIARRCVVMLLCWQKYGKISLLLDVDNKSNIDRDEGS